MEVVVTVTAAGAAGAAVGSGISDVLRGKIESIGYRYTLAPATTTITITETGGLGRTILSVPAGNTAGVAQPRVPVHDANGIVIPGEHARVLLSGHSLTVAVAGANDGSQVTVTIVVADSFLE